MVVRVANAQREARVDTAGMRRLAVRALRRLRVRTPGLLAITFIPAQRIRAVNRRFLRHDRATDVLSFRYDPAPLRGPRAPVGDILIAPREARRYARAHGLPYEQELGRYVVHGILHWLGHEDRTAAQQHRMRAMEDRLLRRREARNGHPHR
jgi:probable rRNA maturation factor